jgi:hypothetical protein
MEAKYLGWENEKAMLNSFRISKDVLEGAEILLASYEREQYDGNAFVLLRRDDKLYEVHGYHCSCYGLERQWDEEETTKEALLYALDNGWARSRHTALRSILNNL